MIRTNREPPPPPPDSDGASPKRDARSSRVGLRRVKIAVGLLVFAGVPLLVLGEYAASQAATDAGPSAAPAAQGTPAAAATTPPAAPGTDATPTAAGAVQPSPSSAPGVDETAARAFRRTPTTDDEGAEVVEPPDFDCLPVAKDESAANEQFPVPLPPFTNDVFPCTRCHDKPDDFNMNRRNLTLDHLNIKLVHGPREQWCYGCHNPTNRDQLRLAGGRTVSFLKSYELCGQCHGTKLRDWRVGIHGRRTGCWNGKQEYLLCVHCHNPHAPKFKPLKPMPRPKKPTEIVQPGPHGGGAK